jgi:hypothetical protein
MRTGRKRKTNRPRKTRLDRLVEEAIVDCYNESEQIAGLYTMIEDNLALPFETMILGVPVTVVCIDLTPRDEIVAVCRRRCAANCANSGPAIAVSPARWG